MLDLGGSINVMPYSIYTSLNLGPLKKTGVIIQLVDRSTAYPMGVLEDILVHVDGLVFPTDFYVLEMVNDSIPFLLGRPFIKMSQAKIDAHGGNLTMKFDDEI